MTPIVWRVYAEPRGERPAEFLGTVAAEDRDDARTTAARTWRAKRFILVSDPEWQSLDERGKAFYECRLVPTTFRQITADVRSCPCQGCGHEVFYRRGRSRTWRQPPTYCKTCDPSPYRQKIAKYSAYTPEPEVLECQTP